jgi:hypothetical protein
MHNAKGLLDRQTSLLEYLTSGEAIFGDVGSTSRNSLLQGFDRALLHIEARFSHEKRMEKIAAVFPKTFTLFGDDRDAIVREFVHACPPVDISRLENARQLYNFLISRWENRPPTLRYLPDVTTCELAIAQVRIGADSPLAVAKRPANKRPAHNRPAHNRPSEIRRNPLIALLHTRFDVRPIFEGKWGDFSPIERVVPLAICFRAGEIGIFELAPEVFDLLAALDTWVAVDELPNAEGLIADLGQAGLLEERR